jgi:hypothetical protein
MEPPILIFREWSLRFGEFPEIVDVMEFGKSAKRIFSSYFIHEPSILNPESSEGLEPSRSEPMHLEGFSVNPSN